jgi:hypothetical protein
LPNPTIVDHHPLERLAADYLKGFTKFPDGLGSRLLCGRKYRLGMLAIGAWDDKRAEMSLYL